MKDLTYDSDDKWPHAIKSVGWALMWGIIVFSLAKCEADTQMAHAVRDVGCVALDLEELTGR